MTGAPTADSARIDGLYELAFRRHQAGQLAEAEQLYRSILEADPRQLDCLHLLGAIALQDGRPDDAVGLIGQAIAANDNIAAYHGSIAEAYRALDKRDDAIAHYRKAVQLDPQYWAARHHLAALLYEQGQADDAAETIWRVLSTNDSAPARALFVQCVRSARALPGDPGFRAVLTRALAEAWGRPVELAPAALTLIRAEPLVAAAIKQIDSVWPQRVAPNALGHCVRALMQNELLHRVLETTPVSDEGIERLLACVRTLLMDAALHATTDIAPEMLPFASALARQCFINDYVFQVPDVERDGTTALGLTVRDALLGSKPPFAIALIAYACYAPLHALERTPSILAREWPAAMAGLLAQQLSEPQEEALYRADLPRLTDITDDVSQRVRAQYEENPYPRWTRTAPVQPASDIASYLHGEFPAAPIVDGAPAETLDILIAGCGSGQQPIEVAQRFPHAHVLGIDLSRTSLGYAQRKAAEMGVTNVEFAQADIAAFKADRMFDAIEASGVLHHMADPMAGWTHLLRLLKPGGFMRLGFYSEAARAGVVAARAFVANGGYDSTPDGIRRCREAMLKTRDSRFKAIFGSPDFYSVSGCRDLLFHVEEHRLTLPQITTFLSDHRLSFLGFELDAAAIAQYRARFADDIGMTNLENWHAFESEDPDTFGGMYQFWVQKAA